VGLVWGRRSERERPEIRIKGRVGRRRGRSVDTHWKGKGARRRRNDIENGVSGYWLSHDHFEGLDGGEWRNGWDELQALTLSRGVARADSGHDCFVVLCTRVRSREKVIIVLDGGGEMR